MWLFLTLLDKINPEFPNRFLDWLDARYYASCGKWHWRFWFEITGQGHAARRYARAVGATRWGRYKRLRRWKKYGRPVNTNVIKFPRED